MAELPPLKIRTTGGEFELHRRPLRDGVDGWRYVKCEIGEHDAHWEKMPWSETQQEAQRQLIKTLDALNENARAEERRRR